ncbi:MAG: alkaline phosphatase family protein [Anaerolineae bacterium]
MLNKSSFDAVRTSVFGTQSRRPLPDTYSFAGLPALVRHVLTGDGPLGLPEEVLAGLPRRYDRVALLFLDAFGWAQAERVLDRSPLLQRIAAEGVISVLTSQFPSTTTAHITSLLYAQPVGQHGLYEWCVYEPAFDRLIVPLLYNFADDEVPNTLPVDPAQLAPGVPLFQTLNERGVRSVAALNRQWYGLRTLQASTVGAAPLPSASLTDGLDRLADAMEADAGPLLAWLYHEGIDGTSHHFGPDAPETAAEVEQTLRLIEERLVRRLAVKGDGRTLVLIFADHGQIGVDPEQTLYVNELVPEIEGLVRRGAGDRPLAPAGSPRDLFLHIQPGRVEEAVALLSAHPALAGLMDVFTVRELADAGLFGATGERFWQRVGDVVVLPVEGQNVWWREKYRVPANRGDHGGLSPQEMEIPLLALAL